MAHVTMVIAIGFYLYVRTYIEYGGGHNWIKVLDTVSKSATK